MSDNKHPYETLRRNLKEGNVSKNLPGYNEPVFLRVMHLLAQFSILSAYAIVIVSLATGFLAIEQGIVVAGGAFIGGFLLLGIYTKISTRYEEKYEGWVDKVVPNNPQKYPPTGYWDAVQGREYPEPPRTAPRELREDNRVDKVKDFIITSLRFIFLYPMFPMMHPMFNGTDSSRRRYRKYEDKF